MLRKARKFTILLEAAIYSVNDILTGIVNESNLYNQLNDDNGLTWFVKMRLLSNSKRCEQYDTNNHYISDKNAIDKFRVKCFLCNAVYPYVKIVFYQSKTKV